MEELRITRGEWALFLALMTAFIIIANFVYQYQKDRCVAACNSTAVYNGSCYCWNETSQNFYELSNIFSK